MILRKAAELQERTSGSAAGDGLSLQAMRDIAREVGLDPQFVDRAASSLPTVRQDRWASILGGPTAYYLEQSLPTELSDERLLDAVHVIRRLMQHQGRVKDVLGTVEWSTVGEVSQVAVTVDGRPNQTAIRVTGDRGSAAVLTLVSSCGAWLLAGAVTGAILEPGVVGGLSIMGTALAAGLGTARALWITSTRNFKRRLGLLMDALGDELDT